VNPFCEFIQTAPFPFRVEIDINKETPVLAKIADQWSPGHDERASPPPAGLPAGMNGAGDSAGRHGRATVAVGECKTGASGCVHATV
jgi:hypothetical protein